MADGLVITGPTASGKTALSVDVAQRIRGEIISIDSRQVYTGMDIGTAKPTVAERGGVPHFGFDVIAPGHRYSAGRFARDARRWLDEIKQRGHTAILVGGTGFFLRALTHPMFHEPPLDPSRKEALKQYLARLTRTELLAWLERLDEVTARRLSGEGGRQRIARAIEVALLTGEPLSKWHELQQPEAPLHFVTFALTLPRDELNRRINQRVEDMLAAGLVQEVKALLDQGYTKHSAGMDATGYREIVDFLAGEKSLEQAKDEIRIATRQYARRQETWFRHQLPDGAIFLDGTLSRTELTNQIVELWNEKSKSE